MHTAYRVVEIYTSEEARHEGRPLHRAVVDHVRGLRIAARCVVTKGVGGVYEDGEVAAPGIEILSYNMPLKIEIVLPEPELARALPGIEAMVIDGVVLVGERRAVAHRTRFRLLPRQFLVRDVMTPSPRAVGPETTVAEIAGILMTAPFKGVPVVDAGNRPVGVVTQGDLVTRAGLPMRPGLLAAIEPEKVRRFLDSMPRLAAREIMGAPPVTARADEPLVKAAETMLERDLKRLPVVDADGRLAGMLSRYDIFRAVARDASDWGTLGKRTEVVHGGRVVGDIMRRDLCQVRPDAPIDEVIRLLVTGGVQRVAVTDGDGRFLGLISDRILLDTLVDQRAGIWELLTSRFSFAKMREHRGVLKDIRSRTAGEVMLRDLVTVHEEMPVDEAIRLMAERSLKRLPVVDADGRFRGMVGRDRLLRAGLENRSPGAPGTT